MASRTLRHRKPSSARTGKTAGHAKKGPNVNANVDTGEKKTKKLPAQTGTKSTESASPAQSVRDYGWDYRGPQWLARALEVRLGRSCVNKMTSNILFYLLGIRRRFYSFCAVVRHNYVCGCFIDTHAQVDVRSIAVFRLLIGAAILWDVLYEFLPDAWWWFSDEGTAPLLRPHSHNRQRS